MHYLLDRDFYSGWGDKGRGGGHPGEEAVSKKFFQPFGLQFGLKIRGLPPPPPPKALPMDPPLRLQVKSIREKNVFSQTYLIGDTKDTKLNNCVKGLDVG